MAIAFSVPNSHLFMRDKWLFTSSVLVAFVLGFLVAYLWQSKQQLDQALNPNAAELSSATVNAQNDDNPESPLSAVKNNSAQDNPKSKSLQTEAQLNATSINDFSAEQALNIVNNMPDYILSQYVDKFMAKGASDTISDKRQFAKRAVEELYSKNDNQLMAGSIKLSFSPDLPQASVSTATLNKDVKLFAHLDTSGKVPSSPFVFVKWVNNQTGQVLLFEKKDILANSAQNWVSFRPYDGWSAGSYDIRFYQFTSELQPIAQLTYDIYEVVD